MTSLLNDWCREASTKKALIIIKWAYNPWSVKSYVMQNYWRDVSAALSKVGLWLVDASQASETLPGFWPIRIHNSLALSWNTPVLASFNQKPSLLSAVDMPLQKFCITSLFWHKQSAFQLVGVWFKKKIKIMEFSIKGPDPPSQLNGKLH